MVGIKKEEKMKKLSFVFLCIFFVIFIYALPSDYNKVFEVDGYKYQINLTGNTMGAEGILKISVFKGTKRIAYIVRSKFAETIVDSGVYKLNSNVSDRQLIIFTATYGSGAYGNVIAYNFKETEWTNITIPELSKDEATGYMGHDIFMIDGDKLIREFPIYMPDDPNCCPKGGKRKIIYKFASNGENRFYKISHNNNDRVKNKAIEIPADILNNLELQNATLASIGAIKSAISIYYGDNSAEWPKTLESIVPAYMNKLPPEYFTGSNKVLNIHNVDIDPESVKEFVTGEGGWIYFSKTGSIFVNIKEKDNKGRYIYMYGYY